MAISLSPTEEQATKAASYARPTIRGEREFRACWPSFFGRFFLDVLFPDSRFWRFAPGVLVHGVAGTRSLGALGGYCRLSRLRRVVAGEL